MITTADLLWPLGIILAWVCGEGARRWLQLPRISAYALVGFALGSTQTGMLQSVEGGAIALLANIAFGLILFELGYRINLHWLRINPWITSMGVLEASATFISVMLVASWLGLSQPTALLIAALGVSSSPAAIVRVTNEMRSAGQVTERLLHLTALNSVLAVMAFKVVVGLWVFNSSGSLPQALESSLMVLLGSGLMGALLGIWVPALLHALGNGIDSSDATVAFALAIVLLVATTHTFQLSPVTATLVFGLVARHRRLTLDRTQRNFGSLGELLTVPLFVYAGVSLNWRHALTGMGLGLILVAVRQVAKTSVVTLLARPSGTSWRKGILTGIALAPMSVFTILLLEQARHLGLGLNSSELASLSFMALLLELLGPVLTQWCLVRAGEAAHTKE